VAGKHCGNYADSTVLSYNDAAIRLQSIMQQ